MDYAQMRRLLYTGQAEELTRATEAALDEGHPVREVLEQGLVAGMAELGEDFKHSRVYVPEVLIAARAMKAALAVIRPLLEEGEASPAGRILIGTVHGDLHDIGKRLVGMMAEGAGFEVIDIGVDVSPEDFVRAVAEHQPDIVAVSALLTTTMTNLGGVVEALDREAADRPRILVGGAPITQAFAEEIGADGYAPDAVSAVDEMHRLVADRRGAVG